MRKRTSVWIALPAGGVRDLTVRLRRRPARAPRTPAGAERHAHGTRARGAVLDLSGGPAPGCVSADPAPAHIGALDPGRAGPYAQPPRCLLLPPDGLCSESKRREPVLHEQGGGRSRWPSCRCRPTHKRASTGSTYVEGSVERSDSNARRIEATAPLTSVSSRVVSSKWSARARRATSAKA